MPESIINQLPPVYQVQHLCEVDNVVAEAVRQARSGAKEGTLLWADTETSAKTQRGNAWQSYPGNLSCALILEPDYNNHSAQQLIYVAAVAAGTAMAEVLSPMTGMSLGWPGKLYVNNLLTGVVSLTPAEGGQDPWPWIVIGLRINVTQHPPNPEPELYNSIHASGETEEVNAEDLMAFYARHFLRLINRWSEEGFEPVHKAWMQRAEDLHSWRRITLNNATVEGVAKGLSESGELILTAADGTDQLVNIQDYYRQ
jgi:BirA family biotin operon repressor/biotin-[acetyl-CoA-carboxylase] ligase